MVFRPPRPQMGMRGGERKRPRRQAGHGPPPNIRPPCAIGIEAKPCSEFRAEERRLLILEPPAGAIATTIGPAIQSPRRRGRASAISPNRLYRQRIGLTPPSSRQT